MCGQLQLQLQAKPVAASSLVNQHWHPHHWERVKRLNKSDKHMSIKSYKGKRKKFISQPSVEKFAVILSINQ